MKRHPEKAWPHPNWSDFLLRVVREELVVVLGGHGFVLKPVTKAMHALGLVGTVWGGGPADGLDAVVGASWCAEEVRRRGVPLIELELMQEIRDYNQVDCKAMMNIVWYLRECH